MPALTGNVTAFFLFDVADAIDLQHARQLVGQTVATRFSPKPPAPPYIQYREPPITVEGAVLGVAEIDRFAVRFKLFDYGVISVALTRPLAATWEDLLADALGIYDNAALTASATQACKTLMDRLAPAIYGCYGVRLAERKLLPIVTDPAVAAFHRQGAQAAFGVLNAELAAGGFLEGSGPTIADLCCYGEVAFAELSGFDLERWPAVARWAERIARLPGFKGPFELLPMGDAEIGA